VPAADAAPSLLQQAEDFASRLTETVQTVAGPTCAPFRATLVEDESASGGGAVFVRQQPAEGITLAVEDEPVLSLTVEYRCTMDGAGKYLTIDESSVKVFPAAEDATDALLRYEYVRSQHEHLPAAHLHVHGQHPDLEEALGAAGTGTRSGKGVQRDAKRGRRPSLRSLHFPVGGHRFRPCLEDVLSMLIEEFGVRPSGSRGESKAALASGRREWRLQQTAAAVRDAPAEAARVLRDLGYTVKRQGGDGQQEHHAGQPHRLEQL
jgi:hypothetical protein